MSQKIISKNSPVQSKVPLTTDLELGELAVNTYDGKLYLKKNDGSNVIVDVTAQGDYDQLVNVPSDFPSASHSHTESEITDLDKYSVSATNDLLLAKADKVGGAVSGNLAALDSNGNLTDSGTSEGTYATSAQGTLADTATQPSDNVSTLTNNVNYLVPSDAQIVNKAEKSVSIISDDVSLISITNPTLANDVTLTFTNINAANVIVQIGGDGFIPVGILPAIQKALIGSFNASGNILPSDASARGEYYVIEVAGTLNLARADDGNLTSIPVTPGDEITWTGRTGDWFYSVGRSATTATSVEYDSAGDDVITSGDLQTALGEIDAALDTLNTSVVFSDDAKADKVTPAQAGNFASLDGGGNLIDSGNRTSTFATSAQGATADSALQSSDNVSALTNDANYLTNIIDIDGGSF